VGTEGEGKGRGRPLQAQKFAPLGKIPGYATDGNPQKTAYNP